MEKGVLIFTLYLSRMSVAGHIGSIWTTVRMRQNGEIRKNELMHYGPQMIICACLEGKEGMMKALGVQWIT